jgi:hypothetical protein
MKTKVLGKLDAIQLERVTAGMLEYVENDAIARFALEAHLHNLNESKGSAAVACFATKFFNSLEAGA